MASRLAAKKPLKAQAYAGSPSTARTATGMTVATAMASKATRKTVATMPRVSRAYGARSTLADRPCSAASTPSEVSVWWAVSVTARGYVSAARRPHEIEAPHHVPGQRHGGVT